MNWLGTWTVGNRQLKAYLVMGSVELHSNGKVVRVMTESEWRSP